jgi:hypothetical protein
VLAQKTQARHSRLASVKFPRHRGIIPDIKPLTRFQR